MQIGHIAGEGHKSSPVHLSARAPFRWMSMIGKIDPRRALSKSDRETIGPPYPTVWIGAGARTAPFSAQVRELSEGATLSVHVLDPRTTKTDSVSYTHLTLPTIYAV